MILRKPQRWEFVGYLWQDPCDWEVEQVVVEGKAGRWSCRRQRLGCLDQGFNLSLVSNGDLQKAFIQSEEIIRVTDRKDASGSFVWIGSESDRAGREYRPEKGWHVKWKEEDESEMPRRENAQGLSFGINVVWKGRGKGRNGGEAKSQVKRK